MFVVLAELGGLTPPTKMRVVVGLAGILGGANPPNIHPGTSFPVIHVMSCFPNCHMRPR